jgi:serine/threonine-protein kinase
MIALWLDPQARLVQLQAVPPAESPVDVEPVPAPDWEALFREAGLDLGTFTPVEPQANPAHFADARQAWEGTYPEAPDLAVRIEAAAYRGRPVSFRVFGPWSEEAEGDSGREQREGYAEFLLVVVVMSLLVSIFFLGRRSMRQGRGDLAGATRIVTALFLASVAARLLMGGHFASAIDWFLRTTVILGMSLFFSMVMFLAYMGLEPYVRRLWPESLISWSRLLAGRLKDPLVGRDLLIGAVAGTFTLLLSRAHTLVPGLLGLPEEALGFGLPEGIAGLRPAVAELLDTLTGVVGNPLVFLVTLVLLRRLVRRTWLAVGLFVMVIVGIRALASPHPVLDAALSAVTLSLSFVVLLRVGLLAGIAMWLFDWGARDILTLNAAAWEGPVALVYGVTLLAVAAYAAWTALGGRSLLESAEAESS